MKPLYEPLRQGPFQPLTAERVTHPRIVPLELWDLVGDDGRTLFEARDDETFLDRLGASVRALVDGDAVHTRSGAVIDPRVRTVRTVVLHGGRIHGITDALERVSRAAALPVLALEGLHDVGPAVAGRRGGIVPVVDLGQTAAKVFAKDGRMRFPRDWSALPHVDRVPANSEALERARATWVHFAEMALRWALRFEGGTDEVAAVVWALPCTVDAQGRPGASSYAGLEGRADMLCDAMARAALWKTRVLLLNDAELAAHAAMKNPVVARGRGATLVLTVGWGVGAALVLGTDEA